MPNRYLRESYIGSERVNGVSLQAEVLWTHLVVTVDDWGRCEANPKLLRPRLFPLRLDSVREADVVRWLAECEKANLVRLYAVGGKNYLQMEVWEKGRAEKSKFPSPPAVVSGCKHLQTSASDGLQPHLSPTPTTIPTTTPTTTSEADASVDIPESLRTDAFAAKWAEYLAFRKRSKHKALLPESQAAQLRNLATFGEAIALAAIDATIANGWQGIFPEKIKAPTYGTPARTAPAPGADW